MHKPKTKAEADKNFKMIMEVLKEEKAKHDAEQEFKSAVKRVYSKPRDYYNRLSRSVKKAGKQSPGGLDCFKEENSYYSKENTERWLSGTSYMENYQAMKEQDSWD